MPVPVLCRATKVAHAALRIGSKEGFLLAFTDGLAFGMKKPFLWFPHSEIAKLAVPIRTQRNFEFTFEVLGKKQEFRLLPGNLYDQFLDYCTQYKVGRYGLD